MYSGNKIIGDIKTSEIRIFVRIFGANKGSLGVIRGALGVPNFYIASLCARNYIPAIKLLAISKTAKLGFSRISGINKGILGVFRGALRVPNYFLTGQYAKIAFWQ